MRLGTPSVRHGTPPLHPVRHPVCHGPRPVRRGRPVRRPVRRGPLVRPPFRRGTPSARVSPDHTCACRGSAACRRRVHSRRSGTCSGRSGTSRGDASACCSP